MTYLGQYDTFKRCLDDEYEMPDKMIAILERFLDQNDGKLSKRSKEKEFTNLRDMEIQNIENKFMEIID